jgi:outer membrane protein assembly factor BamB
MKAYPSLRRALSAAATVLVFAGVLVALTWTNRLASGPSDQPGGHRDWPLFGGTVARNLVNTFDKNVPDSWDADAKKRIKWIAPLGSKAYGGPVVAGGKIFIGTNNEAPRNPGIKGDKGILMCFREADGQFLWQAVHDKLPAGRVNDWPSEGICSSPVVEGNRLYYVSNRCEVVCADTEGFLDGNNDGAQDEKYKGKTDADFIWRLDMIGQLNVFPHNLATCSPLIVGDTLFVITSNGVDEGHINIPQPAAPSFLALDKKTGKVKWSSNLPSVALVEARARGETNVDIKQLVDQGKVLMHGQWSNPVYAEPNGKPMIIFPGGDGWIRAFNPANGELLWKFDCNPKKSVYKLGSEGTRSDFVSTPVVWENKLYIGVGQDPEHDKGVGHFWCIDITKEPANKDRDLSPANDNLDPNAPENKNSGLVWHFGGPADANAERNYVFGRTLSTASVHDGLCYIAEYDGFIHCLDARTGKKYWDHDMQADTWSSPYWVDGKVYIGNEAGRMLVFAHGKEKKLLQETQMKGKIRATPVVANGVLYIITENPCRLHAIQ